nr:chaperonin CPN60-like 2, mitochondrial [Tanacetum cinerariifolium]
MGIHDFLCLPKWTSAEVQEEPYHDIRPTLQWLPFYCTPLAVADAVILDPTPKDLAMVTPVCSAVVILSLENQGRSSADPGAKGLSTQDSWGKGIRVDDVAAPSANASRPRPSSSFVPLFRDVSGDAIHADFFPFSAGPYYATTLKSHHEYVLPSDSRLKGYDERVAGLTGLELQVSALKRKVSGLNDKLSSFDASFAKSKAKGKERKKKIKSLTKSLDNLHAEFSRVQGELLSLAASAGLERKLTNIPAIKDARVSPTIVKESAVTPASKSLELPTNIIPTSSVIALEQNEEWGTSYVLDEVAEVTEVGSEHVSCGPADVVVALSVGKKVDGLLPSSAPNEETTAKPYGVATISTNREREIGELNARAMEKVGKDSVITVADGNTLDNELEVVEGMKLGRGYISPYFVTNTKTKKCAEYEHPLIFIHDKKISDMNSLVRILELAVEKCRPLLIVAEYLESELLAMLIINKPQAGLKRVLRF